MASPVMEYGSAVPMSVSYTHLDVYKRQEILLVLVVFFVLELKLHAENTLLRILIPAICDVAVLVGNALVFFGEEEQPVSGGLHHIADRLRLDEVCLLYTS